MNLTLAIVQTHIQWENIDHNLSHLGTKLLAIKDSVDLVILPEMFSTGFSMNAAGLAEPTKGKTVRWMAEMAMHLNAVITGSLIVEEENKFYNRLIWMRPDGSFETYDKRHLFGLAKEHETYTPGNKRLIVELKGWKICPMICYDLRFPVWARNDKDDPYDLLLYMACWPDARKEHWKALLPARAIENQCFTVGVNRLGYDKEIAYRGDSMVINPNGTILHDCRWEDEVAVLELSENSLAFFRDRFPFLKDQDRFEVEGSGFVGLKN